MPYQRDLVSLPEVGNDVARPHRDLELRQRLRLYGPGASLLRTPTEAAREMSESGVSPYLDPALRNPQTYANFLVDLHNRNLIEWSRGGNLS